MPHSLLPTAITPLMSSTLNIGEQIPKFTCSSTSNDIQFPLSGKKCLFVFFGSAHYQPIPKNDPVLPLSPANIDPDISNRNPKDIDYHNFVTHQVFGQPQCVFSVLRYLQNKNSEKDSLTIRSALSEYYKEWPWDTFFFDPTINSPPDLIPEEIPNRRIQLGFPDALLIMSYSSAYIQFQSLGIEIIGVSPDPPSTLELLEKLYSIPFQLVSDSSFYVRQTIFGIGVPSVDVSKLSAKQKGNMMRFNGLFPFSPGEARQYIPTNPKQIDARQSRIDGRDANLISRGDKPLEEYVSQAFSTTLSESPISSSTPEYWVEINESNPQAAPDTNYGFKKPSTSPTSHLKSPQALTIPPLFARSSFLSVPKTNNSQILYSLSTHNWDPLMQVRENIENAKNILKNVAPLENLESLQQKVRYQKSHIPSPALPSEGGNFVYSSTTSNSAQSHRVPVL